MGRNKLVMKNPIDRALHYLTQNKLKQSKENFVKAVVKFGGKAEEAVNYFDNYCIHPDKMF